MCVVTKVKKHLWEFCEEVSAIGSDCLGAVLRCNFQRLEQGRTCVLYHPD